MLTEEEMRTSRATNEKKLALISHFDRLHGSDEMAWPDAVELQFQEEWGQIENEYHKMLRVAGFSKIVDAMDGMVEVEFPAEWKEAEKNYQDAMVGCGCDPRRIDLAEEMVESARPGDRPRPATEATLSQWG